MYPADESSDCICYGCSGSETDSPVLRTGVLLKKWGAAAAGSLVGQDGY